MKFLSEYTNDVNRCARVYKVNNGYTVNLWDANLEIDDWKNYISEELAEAAAEDFVLYLKG